MLSRPLPRKSGSPAVGFTDNAVKSKNYAPENGSLLHCYTWGSYAKNLNLQKDEEIKKCVLEEAQKYIPGFDTRKIPPPLFVTIKRWNEAVCLSPPGMMSAIRQMKTHTIPVKGLHLAGEYMYMPSVDGALKSGMDAAEKIING